MSSPPTNELRSALGEANPVERMGQRIVSQIRFVAFWTAVTLPFLYVPLLVTGLDGAQLTAFLVLLLANAVALLVGHPHLRE